MAFYTNTNTSSAIASVEFSPVSDGNFTFVYLHADADKDAFKQWLTSGEIGQEIIAEAKVDGQTVIVSHGDKRQNEMQEALSRQGAALTLTHPDRPFNAWAVRGLLSMAGQSLQLASGRLRTGGYDTATVVFAGANIVANLVNMAFGAQKSEDISRLTFLKKRFNHTLEPHLYDGEPLSPTDIDRDAMRRDPPQPKTTTDKAWSFMERHSVRFGEIGLRYLGAFGLAFPLKPKQWQKALAEVGKGELAGAFNTLKNPVGFKFIAGMSYLAGKTIAMFSKIPDPYEDKPHTWIDTLREKYLFRASSVIEGAAAASIAYAGFAKEKITINKRTYRDFLGGTGGTLFALAFLIRLRAKFGVKQLDTDEVYAHATDSLAKVPPEKLPQLMAESAALLKEHMQDKPVHFGEIFTRIMTDMYRFHHIALNNLGTEPEERAAEMREELAGKNGLPSRCRRCRSCSARSPWQAMSSRRWHTLTPLSTYASKWLF